MDDSEYIVVFDGWCRACTRTITMLQRLDRLGRLRMVPCQSIEGVERFGLTRAQCDEGVWVVDGSGKAVQGGEAAMLILATALEQPWLMRIARLPVIRQMVDGGYRFGARIRRRLPGTTPWCEKYPDQCGAREPQS